MASLNIPLMTICVIVLIGGYVVMADNCRPICGNISPRTQVEPNKSCDATDESIGSVPTIINWDDGSQSTFIITLNTQLAVGSCCSTFKSSYYGKGLVISGRFSGDSVVLLFNYRDNRQTCNGCPSSAALSRVSTQTMLSIGTKGVGNEWIECSGTGILVWSPAVASKGQNTFSTLYTDFNCSNCVQSC